MTPAVDNSLLVRKSVTVNAPQAHAFKVFTEQHGSWWPLKTHHIGTAEAKTAIVEPRAGGRWFERGVDGSECDWGRVKVWEPPHRIVLTWDIGADWKCDPNIASEVEVRFIPEGDATRVELEHRKLERFGDKAQVMRGIFDSDRGWSGILRGYAEAAARA